MARSGALHPLGGGIEREPSALQAGEHRGGVSASDHASRIQVAEMAPSAGGYPRLPA